MTPRPKQVLLLLAVGLSTAVLLGCGTEARQDATKSGQTVDRSAAQVIAFPDGFRNVAHKCDGQGHRVYSLSSGNSGTYPNLYVIDDASCSGGGSR